MSLKAKIEAVIYASEEPVTLAQLTGLLGQEGQAELDAIAAQQHSLALEDESALDAETGASEPEPRDDAEALNAEAIVPTEAEPAVEAAEPIAPDAPATASDSVEPTGQQLAREAAAATRLREAEQKLAARKLRDYFRFLLDQLIADYANNDRGLEIREVAGGFRLATKPEYHDAVRGFVKSLKPPLKLTLQALETLAVVAYKQPVTAPEVSEIRGVDSAGVLGSLLTRKLVTTAGRKQVIGRPILYKTTKDFLLRFGLKDINELPSIEEFEKMAGELNEAVQEEIPMESTPAESNSAESDSAEALAESSTPNDELSTDPIELEGHNLQPAEPESIDQVDRYPADEPRDGEPAVIAPPQDGDVTSPHALTAKDKTEIA